MGESVVQNVGEIDTAGQGDISRFCSSIVNEAIGAELLSAVARLVIQCSPTWPLFRTRYQLTGKTQTVMLFKSSWAASYFTASFSSFIAILNISGHLG